MYPRKLFQKLEEHLKKKQITVVTGMRRTGKTTLLKQLLANIKGTNKVYIDLERIDYREMFEQKNYENILLTLQELGLNFKQKAFIALDEIQLVKNLPSALKYLYDNFDIKFVVTGSSSYYLKNLFSESLAGRKKNFELYSLDFGEFLTFKGVPWQKESNVTTFNTGEYERVKHYYEEFIRYGGFPEVVLEKDVTNKKDILWDIISSYINIDIKTFIDFKHTRNVQALMKLLATRAGNKIDFSKLASISGLSRSTVQNYIELLEKTYLIKLIPVLSKNKDREIAKVKKLYFFDTGILNILAEVASGIQFENTIFTQLHHHGEIAYYSLKNGKEIDFILDQKTAWEVKETPIVKDYKNLQRLAENLNIKSCKLIGRYPVASYKNYLWGGMLR